LPSSPAARPTALALALLLAVGAQLGAQSHRDIIRGKVATDSGVAIVGADVIVTMAPSAQVFRDSSRAGGEFWGTRSRSRASI
jgi:hypothetical protein